MKITVTFDIDLERLSALQEFLSDGVGDTKLVTQPVASELVEAPAKKPKPPYGQLKNQFVSALVNWPSQSITRVEVESLMESLGGAPFTGYAYIKSLSNLGYVREVETFKWEIPQMANRRARMFEWKTIDSKL